MDTTRRLITFDATEREAGRRLDAVLAEKQQVSRRKARELCESGRVHVNRRKARPGLILASGDCVESEEITPVVAGRTGALTGAPAAAVENVKQLEVVYEDRQLLVVAKPRAMFTVVHRAEDPLTLADLVATYCPSCREASPDPREAGLLARLDFFTSGLLLCAKSREMWTALRAALFAEQVEKRYLALVEGKLPRTGRIDFPLRQSADGKKMVALSGGGEPGSPEPRCFAAVTNYRRLKVCRTAAHDFDLSLVEAQVNRAKRHQIRAHFAAIGHPLAGDNDYGARRNCVDAGALLVRDGSKREDSDFDGNAPHLPGFFLHAYYLRFRHPITGGELTFEHQPAGRIRNNQ